MKEGFEAILKRIENATKEIRLLPLEQAVYKELEESYQINAESTLGAIIYNTGGIVIDNWIRLYGAGELNFISRNQMFLYDDIVVGEDILGGLFIILEHGSVAYFAPDTLEIEDMEISFSQFLYWCLEGDTDTFYMDYRWKGWKEEIRDMDLDRGISFYPFLWAQAESMEERHREPIPMKEIIALEFDLRNQM